MQDHSNLINFLKDNELLAGLNTKQLETIVAELKEVTVKKGEIIIHENERSDELFFIYHGQVEILKYSSEKTHEHILGHAGRGDVIGELAIIDNQPRSATVRASQTTKLLVLSNTQLRSLEAPRDFLKKFPLFAKWANKQSIYTIIIQNVSKKLAKKLRSTNEKAIEALKSDLLQAKARNALSLLIINALILLSTYIFAFQIFLLLQKNEIISTTLFSIPLLIILVIPLIFMVRHSGYPLSLYGLTLRNWQYYVFEAILFTLPVLAIIVLGKWLLIRFIPHYAHHELFALTLNLNKTVKPIPIWFGPLMVTLYLLFVPVQEFLGRGVLQSSFQTLLSGRHRVAWSIFLSNLLFSTMHSHVSFLFELLVFIPGIFWGWMYARQGTLVGVTVSHLLIGAWALFIVGP